MHAFKPTNSPRGGSLPPYSASAPERAQEPEHADVAYEKDYVQWVEQQIRRLRSKDFAALDLEHIIEELEAMAGRDRRELTSRLMVVIVHLLKCKYQPENVSSSWRGTLREQRNELSLLLDDSPSLRELAELRAARKYAKAVETAAEETGLPRSTFPASNPFTVDQMLDTEYFP